MGKTTINKDGYLVFKDSGKLVHRWVAFYKIYLKNKYHYFLPFRYYQVHHIDGNKLNNNVENLEIITKGKHGKLHGNDDSKEPFRVKLAYVLKSASLFTRILRSL